MTRDDVIAKVRRLYALAEGNANEHEALAAMAAAERLIQAHRLGDIRAEILAGTAPSVAVDSLGLAPRGLWARHLMMSVVRHYACSCVDLGPHGVRVFGDPSDIAYTKLQYGRIKEQVERLAVARAAGMGRSYADAYRKGMAVRIGERLEELLRETRPPEHSTALAVLDQRQARAEQAVAEATEGLVRARPPRQVPVHRAAFHAGHRDGAHVHFGESLGHSAAGTRKLGGGT